MFVKKRQEQQISKNKYNLENFKETNDKLNTAKHTRHRNTSENIHLPNIQRPRKNTYKFKILPGTSQQDSVPI